MMIDDGGGGTAPQSGGSFRAKRALAHTDEAVDGGVGGDGRDDIYTYIPMPYSEPQSTPWKLDMSTFCES